MNEEELKGLAAQLRKPSGEWALRVGEFMNTGNADMNKHAIATLNPTAGDRILEIGMGNGYFVNEILSKHADIIYTGCDYSQEMVDAAVSNNVQYADRDKAEFVCSDAMNMPFADGAFNKIFTVNTLYFWDEREKVLNEISRVLQGGGELIIGIRPKSVMTLYPMTQWGFRMYSADELTAFLTANDYQIKTIEEVEEPPVEIEGGQLPAARVIVSAIR